MSRVGGAAQTKLIKGLSGGIRTDLAQYRELAAFAQFASDLDAATRKQLDRGARVTELLKQPQYSPLPISLMAATLFAVNKGYLDDIDVKKVLAFEHGLHQHLKSQPRGAAGEARERQGDGQGGRGRAERRDRGVQEVVRLSTDRRSTAMAVGKEIRTKIKSVENTKKITKAMEMVAASKMRKAQERMRHGASVQRQDPQHHGQPVAGQPRVQARRSCAATTAAKAVGFIVVTTDKGLCGGLNTNVLRAVTAQDARGRRARASRSQAVAIGNKGLGFLNRIGAKVVSQATQLGDTPQLDKLIGPVKVMLDAFAEGKLDAVYLCYTRFINTMKQEPVVEQLLPLSAERLAQTAEEKTAVRLGLHLRARRADRDRRAADALHRGAGLPGGGREHGSASSRRAWSR